MIKNHDLTESMPNNIELLSYRQVSVYLKEKVNVFVRELYSKTHTVTYSLKYIYSFFYNNVKSCVQMPRNAIHLFLT